MPLPDFRLPAVVFIALALVGCGKEGKRAPSAPLGVAPTYEVRDNAATRRRFNYQDQMTLADRAYQSGSLAAAEKGARAALKLDGNRPEAYLMLATLAARRGEDANAGGLYRKAAELAPERGDVLNNYGAWL
jgi:type IV pilus assembly protein PilF